MRKCSSGVSRRFTLWLTLSLLLAVLVPSACLLWFMNEAMLNEQLAMRQKLAEAYRGHLATHRQLLDSYLRSVADSLDAQAEALSGAELFSQQVRAGFAEGVVVFDTNGNVTYPDRVTTVQAEPLEPAWVAAHDMEATDFTAAASAYARVAESSSNFCFAARALQAQARCLVQAGERTAAIAVLVGPLADSRYQSATDGDGRRVVPNAELLAIELLNESEPVRARLVFERLKQRLNDYTSPLPSAQRRFLMRALQRLRDEDGLFPTLAAEELSAQYLEATSGGVRDSVVRATPLPGVWQFASRRGRVITLHRTASLVERMRRSLPQVSKPDVRVDFVSPGHEASESLLSVAAGPMLEGWQLSLSLQDEGDYKQGTQRRNRLYVWVGVLVGSLVVVLAVTALVMIRRQAALTQLRNDLVANVTHELKTPLASTRLLVETLLNSERMEEKTAREYLELIARENLRLSRLIDNFLTFSRIERNKYTFDFKDVPASSLAEAAAAAVQERFSTPECRFEVSIPADLPKVHADADAMVTALLNLLDNAYKYSGESKQIVFSAAAVNGNVVFSVKDNGIGLSPRDAKQVFKRFYQVNEHLSRSSGGAGLGLSIVQFIVAAHQGTVAVESELKRGSIFTLTIPVTGKKAQSQ
jgi:signal transduction histidine kinase